MFVGAEGADGRTSVDGFDLEGVKEERADWEVVMGESGGCLVVRRR